MAFPDRIAELDRQIAAAVERAVAEVRSELQGRLEKATADLRATLGTNLSAPSLPASYLAAADLEPLASQARDEATASTRASTLDGFRDALLTIDAARQQSGVLEALLGAARGYASRAGVFLLTPEGARGWAASGFADGGRFAEVALEWNEDEAWRELHEGRGSVELTAADCARLLARVEDSLPQGGALVPLVLRDRVAAALYADRLDDQAPWSLAALQALTWCAALALETLPIRERSQTPTLRSLAEAGEVAGLEIWDPNAIVEEPVVAAAPRAEAPPMAAAAAVVEPSPPSSSMPAPPAAGSDEAWEPEPLPEMPAEAFSFVDEPAAETAAFIPPPPAPVETPAIEEEPEVAAGWTYEEAPPPSPEPMIEEPYVAPAEPVSETSTAALELPELPPLPPPVAIEAPAPASALDMSEDDTYLLSRDSGVATPPVAPPVWSAPPPAATRELPSIDEDITHPGASPAVTAPVPQPSKPAWQSGGSTEVAPPADLQGPGWAFATTRIPTVQAATPAAAPTEDATHDEARRLARLLVSEIKLYNEEQVEDGRRNRDIYERLKEDIDRSRQMYEERVDERIRNTTDYFYQELVRILAGGDPKAMGI
jgi:hypothetical protein